MKTIHDAFYRLLFLVILTMELLVLGSLPALAQSDKESGSPSGTTTIDGKQLPPPPPKFGGVIKEDAKSSKPWWPPQIVPPKGAPNVLLLIINSDRSM